MEKVMNVTDKMVEAAAKQLCLEEWPSGGGPWGLFIDPARRTITAALSIDRGEDSTPSPDNQPRYTTQRLRDEIAKAKEYEHSEAAATILSLEARVEELEGAARDVVSAEESFRAQMPKDWEGDPLTDAVARLALSIKIGPNSITLPRGTYRVEDVFAAVARIGDDRTTSQEPEVSIINGHVLSHDSTEQDWANALYTIPKGIK